MTLRRGPEAIGAKGSNQGLRSLFPKGGEQPFRVSDKGTCGQVCVYHGQELCISWPVDPTSHMQAGALSAEVLNRRRRVALAGRSLSSPPGRVNPVPGRPRHPSLGAAPDGPGLESGQQLGQGLDDSGKGWMESWILTPGRPWEGGAQGTTLPLSLPLFPQETCSRQPPWTGTC